MHDHDAHVCTSYAHESQLSERLTAELTLSSRLYHFSSDFVIPSKRKFQEEREEERIKNGLRSLII
jgi:hypothetical protein